MARGGSSPLDRISQGSPGLTPTIASVTALTSSIARAAASSSHARRSSCSARSRWLAIKQDAPVGMRCVAAHFAPVLKLALADDHHVSQDCHPRRAGRSRTDSRPCSRPPAVPDATSSPQTTFRQDPTNRTADVGRACVRRRPQRGIAETRRRRSAISARSPEGDSPTAGSRTRCSLSRGRRMRSADETCLRRPTRRRARPARSAPRRRARRGLSSTPGSCRRPPRRSCRGAARASPAARGRCG